MIQNKKNLLLAKNSVSALALCLVTYASLIAPCSAVGNKRTFDEIDTGDTDERPYRRTRYNDQEMQGERDSYQSAYQDILTTGMRHLKEAEDQNNIVLRNDTLKRLKGITDFYPSASYISARFVEQDSLSLGESLDTAIQYFNKVPPQTQAGNKLFVQACYHKGLCYKKLGHRNEAIATFEAIAELHSSAKAQYGILLYDKSLTLNDSSIQDITKRRAIKNLKEVKSLPEAAYKLGEIYLCDRELLNLKKAAKLSARAELELETEATKDNIGLYDISPEEARDNRNKKITAAYYVAHAKWALITQHAGQNLQNYSLFQNYLLRDREDVRNIIGYLNKVSEGPKADQAAAIKTTINRYRPMIQGWFSNSHQDW